MPTPPPQRTPPPPKPQVLPNPSIFGVGKPKGKHKYSELSPAVNAYYRKSDMVFLRSFILHILFALFLLGVYRGGYISRSVATMIEVGTLLSLMHLITTPEYMNLEEIENPKGKRKETDEQMATLADLFEECEELPRAYRPSHPGWFSNCECGLLDCVCHLLEQRPEAPPPPTLGIKE